MLDNEGLELVKNKAIELLKIYRMKAVEWEEKLIKNKLMSLREKRASMANE